MFLSSGGRTRSFQAIDLFLKNLHYLGEWNFRVTVLHSVVKATTEFLFLGNTPCADNPLQVCERGKGREWVERRGREINDLGSRRKKKWDSLTRLASSSLTFPVPRYLSSVFFSCAHRHVSLFFQETGSLELGCLVRVDEYGFFIYWRTDTGVSVPPGSIFLLHLREKKEWGKSSLFLGWCLFTLARAQCAWLAVLIRTRGQIGEWVGLGEHRRFGWEGILRSFHRWDLWRGEERGVRNCNTRLLTCHLFQKVKAAMLILDIFRALRYKRIKIKILNIKLCEWCEGGLMTAVKPYMFSAQGYYNVMSANEDNFYRL